MKEKIKELYERFYGFNDGLLKSIKITYLKSGSKELLIEISSRDWSDQGESWKDIRITLNSVTEYKFYEEYKTTCQELSNGIHIIEEDGYVGIDFGDLVDTPSSLKELCESRFSAVGKELCIEIRESTESAGSE